MTTNGDAQLLTILMENLLTNSWKFTRDRENPMLSESRQASIRTQPEAESHMVSAESHMVRTHTMILLFAMANGAGCHDMNRSRSPEHDASSKVTFQVHGLMKAKSGAT